MHSFPNFHNEIRHIPDIHVFVDTVSELQVSSGSGKLPTVNMRPVMFTEVLSTSMKCFRVEWVPALYTLQTFIQGLFFFPFSTSPHVSGFTSLVIQRNCRVQLSLKACSLAFILMKQTRFNMFIHSLILSGQNQVTWSPSSSSHAKLG